MNNVAITGHTGFIGSHMANYFLRKRIQLTVLGRKKLPEEMCVPFIFLDLDEVDQCDLSQLSSCDVLIHSAGLSKTPSSYSESSYKDLLKVNVDATLKLARAASKEGVKRFVFISSIKVNGEESSGVCGFTELMDHPPREPYALSKYYAEQKLLELAKVTDMEVVIIRPPLVYGPGVKGNFGALIRLVKLGLPLPLGVRRNKRSFLAIENLVDFVSLCADRDKSPNAANEIFLISDRNDISTFLLLKKISKAYSARTLIIPLPESISKFLRMIFGIMGVDLKLFSNLEVNTSKAENVLGWVPVISMDRQLDKMAQYDLALKRSD